MAERRVVVGSTVGLHARPASLFVQATAKAPVRVAIAKDGGTPVDARSILSVIGLDAHGGDTVMLSAEGDGADAASTSWQLSSRPTTTHHRTDTMNKELHGLGVSAGSATGPVARLGTPRALQAVEPTVNDTEAEARRATAALEAVGEFLQNRGAAAGGQAADVLVAEAMMARDPALATQVQQLARARPAAWAVSEALASYQAMQRSTGSSILAIMPGG